MKYGLSLIIVYQYWFLNYNEYAILMEDVNNREIRERVNGSVVLLYS